MVSEIFARLRGDGSYRSAFGRYKVTAVRDLAEGHGYDSETADKQPSLPVGAGGTHFLTFKLGEEGVVATLRTSGTEPKIKYVFHFLFLAVFVWCCCFGGMDGDPRCDTKLLLLLLLFLTLAAAESKCDTKHAGS